MANDELRNGNGAGENGEEPETDTAETAIEAFDVRLGRIVRTESSEVYLMWEGDNRLGQVDVHFGWDLVHATLILERDLTKEQQALLVDLIDQDIISSHLPRFAREDFLVTVFRGTELDSFSDGPDEADGEEEDDY